MNDTEGHLAGDELAASGDRPRCATRLAPTTSSAGSAATSWGCFWSSSRPRAPRPSSSRIREQVPRRRASCPDPQSAGTSRSAPQRSRRTAIRSRNCSRSLALTGRPVRAARDRAALGGGRGAGGGRRGGGAALGARAALTPGEDLLEPVHHRDGLRVDAPEHREVERHEVAEQDERDQSLGPGLSHALDPERGGRVAGDQATRRARSAGGCADADPNRRGIRR